MDGNTAPTWDGASTNPQYSLITHNGCFALADGATDWVMRTPDGGLFIYPGDGYGSLDVSRRIVVRLPANASPTTFSEIKSAGDITGDDNPDIWATNADGALLLHHGGATSSTLRASGYSTIEQLG